MNPEYSSSYVKNASGYTYYEMIIEALSAINYENGVDIDEIFNFIKERHEVPPNFRKRLRDKLKKLVSQNILAKVEDCYKILDGTTAEATNPEDLRNLQELQFTSLESGPEMDAEAEHFQAEDLRNLQELQITSLESGPEMDAETEHLEFQAEEESEDLMNPQEQQITFMEPGPEMDAEAEHLEFQAEEASEDLRNPQELQITSMDAEAEHLEFQAEEASEVLGNLQELQVTSLEPGPEMDAIAKVIAEADHLELQAEEASEAENRIKQLLKESCTVLEFAEEVLDQCTKGEKFFLR